MEIRTWTVDANDHGFHSFVLTQVPQQFAQLDAIDDGPILQLAVRVACDQCAASQEYPMQRAWQRKV